MNAQTSIISLTAAKMSRGTMTAVMALDAIASWQELSDQRRRNLQTAVRMLARAFGRPLETIGMEPKAIAARLDATGPVACGLSPSSFTTYRAMLRDVLRRLGVLDPKGGAREPLPDAWQSLIGALPGRLGGFRLGRFARFCASLGLGPAQVADATLAAYFAHLQSVDMKATARDNVRRVADDWNRAAGTIPGWPCVRLASPEADARQYTFPFSDFPSAFQTDVARFQRRLTREPGEPLFADGPNAQLRPASVQSRMVSLRGAAAALVHSGVPIAAVTSLSVLVEPANARKIMEFHFTRAGDRRSHVLGSVADTLRILGKYHCALTADDRAQLLADTKQAKPRKQAGMTAKNSSRLMALEDPVRRACLLHLPEHLLREATKKRDGWTDRRGVEHLPREKEAAWLAGVAAAIEIVLHCPLRIENLAGLRIGQHLLAEGSRGGRITHLRIMPESTKNEVLIEWPIGRETSAFLDRYIREFRLLLQHAGGDWLFPARNGADMGRRKGGLAVAMKHEVHRAIGVAMNEVVPIFRAGG
jgi:hypothetical protein